MNRPLPSSVTMTVPGPSQPRLEVGTPRGRRATARGFRGVLPPSQPVQGGALPSVPQGTRKPADEISSPPTAIPLIGWPCPKVKGGPITISLSAIEPRAGGRTRR
jgi:hypothetical protein